MATLSDEQRVQLELDQIHATVENMRAEADKFRAESLKLSAEGSKYLRETRWYPTVVVATSFAAGAGLVTAVLSLARAWH